MAIIRDLLESLFRKPITAERFERCAFSLVTKRVDPKNADAVEEELNEIAKLPSFNGSATAREKLAAHWYLLLENYIGKEQPRGRIPAEILREMVLNKCHPERALGNFAFLFLPTRDRQIKLFARFAGAVFQKVPDIADEENRQKFFHALETDKEIRDIIKDGKFSPEMFARKLLSQKPAERSSLAKIICKRALGLLSQKISPVVGELRTELLFKNSYQELRDSLPFIDDVPSVLLLVPEEFLEEERIELMEKSELEEELRRKKQALETTSAQLEEEKSKLSSLSRKELEKRAEERTAELVSALKDLNVGRAKLEEAKAKDEAFLENVGEGLAAIDLKGNIILWNRAAGVISGWQKEEVFGKQLSDFIRFIHERDRTPNMAFIDEAILLGKTQKAGGDTVLATKYDKDVFVNVTASPISDGRGHVTSAIVIFRDITNERELQKTREEFASLATHELRTPVAAIKGYASLLLDKNSGYLSETHKKYIERISHANEKLLALINAILNVSRIELGMLAIQPQPTYLPDVAEAVLAELSPKIEEKKLNVKKDYDRQLTIVDLDPGLMNAVLQNLLSNAVKYSPDGGTINLQIKKEDEDILIRVADNGCGIPKNQQSKIFSKLFRADNVAQKTEGTGLGLYIVKSVLDQFGGKIWFESDEKKGTTFFVTTPLSGMEKREGIKGLT